MTTRCVKFKVGMAKECNPRAGPRGVDYGGALKVERLNRAAQAASGGRVGEGG